MKVGVLAWEAGEPESEGIARLARDRGHDSVLFEIGDIGYVPGRHGGVPVVGDDEVTSFDVIVSRAHVGHDNWRDAVEQLELLSSVPEVLLLDPAAVHVAAVSKLAMVHRLTRAGLPVPPTRSCRTAEEVAAACAGWGTSVVKPSVGFGGNDVERLSGAFDRADQAIVADLLERYGQVLCQPFLAHVGDLRITMIGDQPSVCVRSATGGDTWRPRHEPGARTPIEVFEPDEELLALARRATHALNLSMCGVDVIRYGNEYVVIEANVVPGWDGFPTELQDVVNADVLDFVERTYASREKPAERRVPVCP
ncbi:ATP-grasp domain-containing protein [Micromonospora echinospora]